MPVCSNCGTVQSSITAFCTKCGSAMPAGVQTVGGVAVGSLGSGATPSGAAYAMPGQGAGAVPVDLSTRAGARFIGQWNWGAAILYPFWLMTHRLVALGIILLIVGMIPYLQFVPFIAFFVFGFLGNKLAVASGRYTDEATFVAVQNKWRNWGFIFIVASLIIVAFTVMVVLFFVPHGRTDTP